jgi:hypothetical protein
MRGNSLDGKREIPQTSAADGATGRPEKVNDRTTGMHVCGKSDDSHSTREAVEQRRDAGGDGGGKAIN